MRFAETLALGNSFFFFVTRNLVLMSCVGVVHNRLVDNFTKSGECSLTVLNWS